MSRIWFVMQAGRITNHCFNIQEHISHRPSQPICEPSYVSMVSGAIQVKQKATKWLVCVETKLKGELREDFVYRWTKRAKAYAY